MSSLVPLLFAIIDDDNACNSERNSSGLLTGVLSSAKVSSSGCFAFTLVAGLTCSAAISSTTCSARLLTGCDAKAFIVTISAFIVMFSSLIDVSNILFSFVKGTRINALYKELLLRDLSVMFGLSITKHSLCCQSPDVNKFKYLFCCV